MNFKILLQKEVSETWQANCPAPWRTVSLVPEVWEVGQMMGRGQFDCRIFHISIPSWQCSSGLQRAHANMPFHCRVTFCTILSICMGIGFVPRSNSRTSSLEGSSKIYTSPLSKHEYITFCWVVIFPGLKYPPSKTEFIFITFRHLWLLGISHLCWLKQGVPVASVHWLWAVSKDGLKNKKQISSSGKPFRYLKVVWVFQSVLPVKEGSALSPVLLNLAVFSQSWISEQS